MELIFQCKTLIQIDKAYNTVIECMIHAFNTSTVPDTTEGTKREVQKL